MYECVRRNGNEDRRWRSETDSTSYWPNSHEDSDRLRNEFLSLFQRFLLFTSKYVPIIFYTMSFDFRRFVSILIKENAVLLVTHCTLPVYIIVRHTLMTNYYKYWNANYYKYWNAITSDNFFVSQIVKFGTVSNIVTFHFLDYCEFSLQFRIINTYHSFHFVNYCTVIISCCVFSFYCDNCCYISFTRETENSKLCWIIISNSASN